jgi:intracellular septation protein
MKFLFDIFPIILFFAAYKWQGIYAATGVAIGATVVQIGWSWFRHRKVDTMLWVSLAVIGIFGGATLIWRDPTFIKWKPTVLYWLFAATLFISNMLFKKNIIKEMLKQQINMPETVWNKLNLYWAGFFTFMGAMNIYVAYNFSENSWVNFKLFGSIGLMLIFVLLQGMVLSKYIEEDKEPK